MDFVLIPSPLLRAASWEPVGSELRRRGHTVHIPELIDSPDSTAPYWRQHAEAVAAEVQPADPFVLVGHSGAGALLPAIADAIGRPPSAYVLVDAALPSPSSRLDELAESLGREAGDEFRARLESDSAYPDWDEDDLAPLVPDAAIRRSILEMTRPRGLPFWVEPIGVPDTWPDAPCAFLRLSPAYESSARAAQSRGWPTRRLDGAHFDIMIHPAVVANEILDLLRQVVLALSSSR